MTSSTGKQISAIHILPNISRSKDNQTMKFGQLLNYSMRIILRNIFLEKSCTKCVEKASLRLFSNKLKMSISLDKQSEIIYFAFIASPIRGLPKYIKTNVC